MATTAATKPRRSSSRSQQPADEHDNVDERHAPPESERPSKVVVVIC